MPLNLKNPLKRTPRDTTRKSPRNRSVTLKLSPGVIGGIVATVLLLGFLIWQATFLNGLLVLLHSGVWFWMPLLIATIVSVVGWYKARGWIMGLSVVIYIGTFILIAFAGYYSAKTVYAQSVTVNQPKDNTATFSEYNHRAPLTVARQQTASNVTINGQVEDTTYIASMDRFGAAVRKPGITDGYGQVVFQQIGPNGQSIDAKGVVGNQNCTFSEAAGKRFGGWFGANLKRAILRERFGVIIDEDDSYAYCTPEGKPMMIVPLKKIAGFPFTYQVPAGVAVYNGETGELTVDDEVTQGEYPGPVYPVSLSKQSRDSSRAAGSLWDYWMSNVGYSDTTSDANDPNSENNGEFTLAKKDKSGDEYATPLTMKGRSSAITAVGTVSSSTMKSGSLNPYSINILPSPRQANSAVADKIHTDYSSLDWAAGIEVFEIVPSGPNQWEATLGRSKSIMYTMKINADSSSCLYDLSGNKLRCTNDKDKPVEPGSKTIPDDLSTLSNEQLMELQKKVQAEVEKRLTKR